jgi:membrane protease YdiL (CAAX protease family)
MNLIKKELYLFVAITLSATYLFGILTWYNSEFDTLAQQLTMYIPAVVVMILYKLKFKKPVFKNGDLGFRFTGWKYWFIAPLVLTLLSLVAYFISYVFDPDLFLNTETIKASLTSKGFYFGSIFTSMIVIFLLNGVIGSILNIPMFLGEELGWRGFMMPRLIKLFNPKIAFLIGGTIWALWHMVMIAQGLNYPNHFFLGIGMMILMCIPVGMIIQYFYFRSKSIFVAVLAHAALNKSAMSMTFVIDKAHYNTFLFGPTGIIGIIIFYMVAIYLFSKIDWQNENPLKVLEMEDVESSKI